VNKRIIHSVLRRGMIYSLCYGEKLKDHPLFKDEDEEEDDEEEDEEEEEDEDKKAHQNTRSSTDWVRLAIVTFVSSDMVRHVRSKSPGLVKTTVGYVLAAYKVPKDVYGVLHRIGVCMSYSTLKRQQHKHYAECLRLLHPIFCVTHAIGYAFLTSMFLVNWFCMPTSEKLMYCR
jgi:hypothetical protein